MNKRGGSNKACSWEIFLKKNKKNSMLIRDFRVLQIASDFASQPLNFLLPRYVGAKPTSTLSSYLPLQIFRPTYGPKILQEIPTIEVVCAHVTVYISEQ